MHVEKLDQRQSYLKIGVGNQNIHSSLKPASDFPTYIVDTNSGLCRLRQRSLESLCSCKVQHYTICQLFETKLRPSVKTRAFTNVFSTITILLPPFFWNLVANIDLICFEVFFVSQVFVS